MLKVEDGKGKVQGTEKGTVYMKGQKYRVDMAGRNIFCDGKNISYLSSVEICLLRESKIFHAAKLQA